MSLTVHTTISFKDVEYALETFDGTTNQDVLVWIRSFERFALSSKWDEVQKYLFARRLLRKAAKFAVEANDNLGTWTELSEYLKLRFSRKLTDKELHAKLGAENK